MNKYECIEYAKCVMKASFDVDLAVEFVDAENFQQRKTKLVEQYDRNVDNVLSLFMPAKENLPPIILVQYNNIDWSYIDYFYHELQHAFDYYEALPQLGEKGVMSPYFHYYTEYNASYAGTLHYTKKLLSVGSNKPEILAQSKDKVKKTLSKLIEPKLQDVLHYFGMTDAFAEIEGGIDNTMLTVLPQPAHLLCDLVNYMHQYEPTLEWYNEFKRRIDVLQRKD